jgi:UDP-2-acetamido-3-amino-2,3-dideoxy-glucuronate N-acetyltransferase
VNKDVKPYALMVGVPAKHVGWMSEYGEQIPLPNQGEGQYTCPHTNQVYTLSQDQLKRK